MLYRIARPFATIALKTNFRRIYFSNAQVIPKNKPIILAVNHPTAFLEPCLLACLLDHPLHFLVRGDMFENGMAKKVLSALHMIPIFRKQDAGYGKLRENYSSFEKCIEILKENKWIMILAEGTTIQEKRLRPIQKGTARIAFSAIEKQGDLDIKIVPVGVNYTYADKFRSHVMFEFGAPISVQNYKDAYVQHPNRAVGMLTNELKKSLENHVVIIEKKEDEALVEKLFVLFRNNEDEAYFPIVSRRNWRLKAEKQITQNINQMPDNEKLVLTEQVDFYLEELRKNKLCDFAIANLKSKRYTGNFQTIVGFIPHIIGYVGNYLPVFIASLIAAKYVKYLEFMASVKIAVSIGAFFLYYLLLIVFSIFLGNFMVILMVFLLPVFGYYSLIYREYFEKWKAFRTLKNTPTEKIKYLQELRGSILRILDENR